MLRDGQPFIAVENSIILIDEDYIRWDKVNSFKGIIQRNRIIRIKR
jgi:hypothetical protein